MAGGRQGELEQIRHRWTTEADVSQRRDEKLVEAAVQLLAQIIRVLTPLPFFRNLLIGIVDKLLAPQERYHDHVSCPPLTHFCNLSE